LSTVKTSLADAKVQLRKLSELRSVIGSIWINTAQAAEILNDFDIKSNEDSTVKQSAITILFSRLIDPENLPTLMTTLPTKTRSMVYNKIGWLNAINIMHIDKIEHYFSLDLSICDNWKMAYILIQLVYHGGGLKLKREQFRKEIKPGAFLPRWEIPPEWQADGLNIPKEGFFVAESVSVLEKDKPRGWKKMRQSLSQRFSIFAVPKGDGRDLHSPVLLTYILMCLCI
jgi:hypothetical protein